MADRDSHSPSFFLCSSFFRRHAIWKLYISSSFTLTNVIVLLLYFEFYLFFNKYYRMGIFFKILSFLDKPYPCINIDYHKKTRRWCVIFSIRITHRVINDVACILFRNNFMNVLKKCSTFIKKQYSYHIHNILEL